MASEKQFSDLSMSRVECPKCGATWINGQFRWSGTGKLGNEKDLAGGAGTGVVVYAGVCYRHLCGGGAGGGGRSSGGIGMGMYGLV